MSKNEKMKILEMLEKKQITADEAARLLQAAGEGNPSSPPNSTGVPRSAHQPGSVPYSTPPSSSVPPYSGNDNGRRMSSTPSGGESFADELGRKFDTFIRDIEPKVQRFTEVVVEKTASAADKISKSLSTPTSSGGYTPPSASGNSAGFTPRPASPSTAPTSGGNEQTIERKVSSFDSELNITGFNGQVLIKGYNGDKISARILTRPKRHGASVELMELGNKYFLQYDDNDFHQVSIDAYVPESMFYVLKLSSVNGLVNVSTMKTTHLVVENINGDIELNNVSAESVKVECQNGHLRLTNVIAANGSVENFNGGINASGLDVSKLNMSTFNGAINLNMAGFYAYDNYVWSMESSNGKMSVYLPSSSGLGYHLKTHASLGETKIGLTGINYIINEKSFAEAKSFNFESAQKQVRLVLETSNAPLIVN